MASPESARAQMIMPVDAAPRASDTEFGAFKLAESVDPRFALTTPAEDILLHAIQPQEHRSGRLANAIHSIGRAATAAIEWAGYKALPGAVNFTSGMLPGRAKHLAPAVLGFAAGAAFTKLGGFDFSHLFTHDSDALMASGGAGSGHHFDHVRLMADTAQISPSGSTTHRLVNADGHADKLYAQPGATISDAYARLPGDFHENWDQMIHDAKAAHLKIVHQNGKFFYEAPDGQGGWTSNQSEVLRDMASHSGGHRVFAGSATGTHANPDHAPATVRHNSVNLPNGAESHTAVTGGHDVTLENAHEIGVSQPPNVLTPYGKHFFTIKTPDDIELHNGEMQLDQSDMGHIDQGLHKHGLYATYHTDSDTGYIDHIDIRSLKHPTQLDLRLPQGYGIDYHDQAKIFAITTPDGDVVHVDVPDRAINPDTGFIDFGQVQPAIKSALDDSLRDQHKHIVFDGLYAHVEPAANAAQSPVGSPTPSGTANRMIVENYRETTPWWVWPSLIGALALGAIGGAAATRRGWTERVRDGRVRSSDKDRPGDASRPILPLDGVIAPSAKTENNPKVLLQNQVRSILLDPKSQPVSEFLTQIRSLDLRDDHIDETADEKSAAALIAYGEAMRAEGVVQGDNIAEKLNSHMAATGIEMGTAKFYQGDDSKLREFDRDKSKSTRNAAAQLKGKYQHLPPSDAFLGNKKTDEDLAVIGDDDIEYKTNNPPKPGTNLLWDYAHILEDTEAYKITAVELRLRLQNILNRIRKSTNNPRGTLIALGLDGIVGINDNGRYTFEDENIKELAKQLVSLQQPEPQVRTAPEAAESEKLQTAGPSTIDAS